MLDLQRTNKRSVMKKPRTTQSLKRRAMNSLVADYLKLSSYDCSLSVFLPESQASHNLFKRDDVLEVWLLVLVLLVGCWLVTALPNLVVHVRCCSAGSAMPGHTALGTICERHLHQPRATSLRRGSACTMRTRVVCVCSQQASSKSTTALLELLLDQLVTHNKVSKSAVSCGIQTDTQAGASEVLAAKLQAVQDQYFHKSQGDRDGAGNGAMGERFARYQRECDARAKREIEIEVRAACSVNCVGVERRRTHELVSMRVCACVVVVVVVVAIVVVVPFPVVSVCCLPWPGCTGARLRNHAHAE